MSLSRAYKMQCDTCKRRFAGDPAATPRLARAAAKRHGWARLPLPESDPLYTWRNHHADLCPDCVAKYEETKDAQG